MTRRRRGPGPPTWADRYTACAAAGCFKQVALRDWSAPILTCHYCDRHAPGHACGCPRCGPFYPVPEEDIRL